MLSAGGPLMMALGTWRFRRTSRRVFLWVTVSGTVLFGTYGFISTVDSVRNWLGGNDTNLGLFLNLLWLALPVTAIWGTVILFRKTRPQESAESIPPV